MDQKKYIGRAARTFAVTERLCIHFESEFANLFNILNWDAPNMNVANKSFG